MEHESESWNDSKKKEIMDHDWKDEWHTTNISETNHVSGLNSNKRLRERLLSRRVSPHSSTHADASEGAVSG